LRVNGGAVRSGIVERRRCPELREVLAGGFEQKFFVIRETIRAADRVLSFSLQPGEAALSVDNQK